MKQFELTILTRDLNSLNTFETKIIQIDKIESDDLIHLLTQFNYIILDLQRKLYKKQVIDDDIPF